MKTSLIKPLPLLAAVIFVSAPASLHAGENDWAGTCRVTFSGESTLHDFTGTVDAEPFTVSISSMTDLEKAKASSHVVVKAADMDTGNKKRDVEMRKCLDAATYPEIVVDFTDLPVSATKPVSEEAGPRPTVVPFTMSLKGREHKMTGSISNWSNKGDEVDCVVTFPVSLSASGITPPGVLGVIKVKDEIKVSAAIHLKRG